MSRLQSFSKESFATAVERVVKRIPKGSVLSYGTVAVHAGFPGAARAVGSLMKKNHDPSIPCHRVIRGDGRCGEYNGGGETQKAQRLHQEGVVLERKILGGQIIWRVRGYRN